MNIMEQLKKVDKKKVLSVAVTGLGLAVTLLSGKVESNNREALKDELKKDLLKELSENTKGS